MKFTTMGMAGISTLLGLALMSTVMAAVPADGDRRPAFEGGRGQAAGNRGGRLYHRRGARPAQQIERMDTNDDGQVSEDEFIDARLARIDNLFERMDRNDDGLISLEDDRRQDRPDRPERAELRDEVLTCVRETLSDFVPNAEMDLEERFDDTDTDGNGSITLGELSTALEASAHQIFANIDADGDGFLTNAEFGAHRQARREARRACVKEIV